MGSFNMNLLFPNIQANLSAMQVVWVLAISRITSRRPQTLLRGILEATKTPSMRLHRKHNHYTALQGFRLLNSKTTAYRNSVLAALSRLRVHWNVEQGYDLQEHFFRSPLLSRPSVIYSLHFTEEAENSASNRLPLSSMEARIGYCCNQLEYADGSFCRWTRRKFSHDSMTAATD